MTSLKKQLIALVVTCLVVTVLFGVLLSVAVNLTLKQLEDQPDLILPGSGAAPAAPE